MYRLVLVACSAAAAAAAAPRGLPAITGSLVNLGRMDIAFYVNSKPQDVQPARSLEAPCPCARRGPPRSLADLLDPRLLSHAEPDLSPLCCDSHEQMREDSIVFDFGPKQSQAIGRGPAGRLPPLLLDSLGPGKPTQLAGKQHFVELFLFPNKKEIALDLGKMIKKHEDIKIVGDKEIRNDFKIMKLIPPLSSSVKKDLAVQENKSKITFNAPDNANAIANTSTANVV